MLSSTEPVLWIRSKHWVWLIFAIYLSAFSWNSHPKYIVWDTFGHYLYLPQVLIHADPGISDFERFKIFFDTYQPSSSMYQIHPAANGNFITQYPMGMALLHLPAFTLGHVVAGYLGFAQDGYSQPYQWAILLSHFSFVLMGLFGFRKFILCYFNEFQTSLLLLCLAFGTNYLWASVEAVFLPHVFVFALACILLTLTLKFHTNYSSYLGFVLGLIVGLMTLCRFTEILWMLVPLFWGVDSFRAFGNRLKSIFGVRFKAYFMLGLGILLSLSLQFTFWYTYAGELFYYAYQNAGEGFDFLSPHTLNFLFSFRKGWFIYTPMMLIAIAGIYLVFIHNKPIFYTFILFLVLHIYVVSSWSNWWYASSFGQRAMIETYGLLALPLGYVIQMLQQSKKIIRWLGFAIFILLIILNIFQTWQARKWILHPSRNTRTYYFKVFGRTQPIPDQDDYLLVDRTSERTDVVIDTSKYVLHLSHRMDVENQQQGIQKVNRIQADTSTNHFLVVNDTMPFSDKIEIPFEQLTRQTDHARIRIRFKYCIMGNPDTVKPVLVTAFLNRKQEMYAYTGLELGRGKYEAISGKWHSAEYTFLTPEVRDKNDPLIVYFWMNGKGVFFADDIEIHSFVKKEKDVR